MINTYVVNLKVREVKTFLSKAQVALEVPLSMMRVSNGLVWQRNNTHIALETLHGANGNHGFCDEKRSEVMGECWMERFDVMYRLLLQISNPSSQSCCWIYQYSKEKEVKSMFC